MVGLHKKWWIQAKLSKYVHITLDYQYYDIKVRTNVTLTGHTDDQPAHSKQNVLYTLQSRTNSNKTGGAIVFQWATHCLVLSDAQKITRPPPRREPRETVGAHAPKQKIGNKNADTPLKKAIRKLPTSKVTFLATLYIVRRPINT